MYIVNAIIHDMVAQTKKVVCIYNNLYVGSNPRDYSYTLIQPKLILEDSNAGSFECTIPKGNVIYDELSLLTDEIVVYRNTGYGNNEVWRGRVLQDKHDWYGNRTLTCEGELGYLNDTVQPQIEYETKTYRQYLEALLSIHNEQVNDSSKEFTVGIVDFSDTIEYTYTNYERTIEVINELAKTAECHIRVRWTGGVRYLDLLKDPPRTSSQVVQFGTNLLDFARNYDVTNFCTAVLPLGDRITDTDSDSDLEKRVTIESVNNNSPYLQNATAVASYGWVCGTLDLSEITSPSKLKTLAQKYLESEQFGDMTLEVKIVDLQMLNKNLDYISLLDNVRVISKPHGLNKEFPVTKMEIPLDDPANTTLTMGSKPEVSLTSANNKISTALFQALQKQPSVSSILKSARDNATQIMNEGRSGYITFVQDLDGHLAEMYISTTPNYQDSNRWWRWNSGGLAYTKDGGNSYTTAITNDGKIVADAITTGTMFADRIHGGKLTLGGFDDENGKIIMYDEDGVIVGSWDCHGWRNFKDDTKFYIGDGCAKGFITSNSWASQTQTGLLDLSANYGDGNYAVSLCANTWDLMLQSKRDIHLQVYEDGTYRDVCVCDRNGLHPVMSGGYKYPSGSFTDKNGNYIQVTDGLITSIS